MRRIISKHNRVTLAMVITLVSVLSSLSILLVGYSLFSVEIRFSEIAIGIIAPLLIAPSVTWFLFGLLKELDLLEKEMRNMATYDQLTNALTRTAFFEKASNLLNLAKREFQQLSILMIDLDNFKQINDRYGHAGGDFVLGIFGEMMNKHKRKTDLFGRLGGEEFVLILWRMNIQDAVKYSRFLHNNLEHMNFKHNKNFIRCSISIGITHYKDSNIDAQLSELLEQADDALYQAKETGRNKTIIYSEIANKGS